MPIIHKPVHGDTINYRGIIITVTATNRPTVDSNKVWTNHFAITVPAGYTCYRCISGYNFSYGVKQVVNVPGSLSINSDNNQHLMFKSPDGSYQDIIINAASPAGPYHVEPPYLCKITLCPFNAAEIARLGW
jgi:hypothetical protein